MERLTQVIQKVERLLPCTAEQAFDLASDVERYPEYLPGWIAARIRKREANVYHTDQVLGLGPIRLNFASRTVLHRPTRIDVTSEDFPFRRLRLSWSFEPRPGAGCGVAVSVEFDLRVPLLQRICDRVLPAMIGDIMAAFERRAGAMYKARSAQ